MCTVAVWGLPFGILVTNLLCRSVVICAALKLCGCLCKVPVQACAGLCKNLVWACAAFARTLCVWACADLCKNLVWACVDLCKNLVRALSVPEGLGAAFLISTTHLYKMFKLII